MKPYGITLTTNKDEKLQLVSAVFEVDKQLHEHKIEINDGLFIDVESIKNTISVLIPEWLTGVIIEYMGYCNRPWDGGYIVGYSDNENDDSDDDDDIMFENEKKDIEIDKKKKKGMGLYNYFKVDDQSDDEDVMDMDKNNYEIMVGCILRLEDWISDLDSTNPTHQVAEDIRAILIQTCIGFDKNNCDLLIRYIWDLGTSTSIKFALFLVLGLHEQQLGAYGHSYNLKKAALDMVFGENNSTMDDDDDDDNDDHSNELLDDEMYSKIIIGLEKLYLVANILFQDNRSYGLLLRLLIRTVSDELHLHHEDIIQIASKKCCGELSKMIWESNPGYQSELQSCIADGFQIYNNDLMFNVENTGSNDQFIMEEIIFRQRRMKSTKQSVEYMMKESRIHFGVNKLDEWITTCDNELQTFLLLINLENEEL